MATATLTSAYDDLSQALMLKSAHFIQCSGAGTNTSSSDCIEVLWKREHRPSNETNTFMTTHHALYTTSTSTIELPASSSSVEDVEAVEVTNSVSYSSTPPVLVGSERLCSRKLAVSIEKLGKCKRDSDEARTKQTFVSVVDQATRQQLVHINVYQVCGELPPSGSLLSGQQISSTQKFFAFSADAKRPKTASFWKDSDAVDEKESDAPTGIGHEYNHKDHWGEGLSKLARSVIVEVDIATGSASALSSFSADYSWCQPQYRPDDDSTIVAVGFKHEPRRLGLLHFNTRASVLCLHKRGERTVKNLVPDDHSPLSPRFSPDGRKLAFVSTDESWLHTSCGRLRVLDMASGAVSTVVEIVHSVPDADTFPGLWLRTPLLPSRIFLKDSIHIVLCSQWGVRLVPLLINIDSGNIRRLRLPRTFEHGSASLLDIDVATNTLLFAIDDVALMPVLFTCTVNPEFERVEWKRVTSPTLLKDNALQRRIESISCRVLEHRVKDGDSTLRFESMLVLPKDADSNTRLVVFPHGGPHSGFTRGFSLGTSFLCSQGLGLLLVNYRGSTGYGQELLMSLPGHCSVKDVSDCITATSDALKAEPLLSRDNLSVFGGSHGGFLSLSLIGQFPDMFKSAVVRNPVTNIAHMLSCSDIPDWCLVECGVDYRLDRVPTAEDYATLYKASPIALAAQVKTPVLLQLGDADLRVPMSQSLDYYKMVRSCGTRARCIVYPDNQHGLADAVNTSADHWINAFLWLSGPPRDE